MFPGVEDISDMTSTIRIEKYDVIPMQMAARHAGKTTPSARRPIESLVVHLFEDMPRI